MEKKRKELLEKNPLMVDDIGDREKYEVEYSIFMENEKKPGFTDQILQQKLAEKKFEVLLSEDKWISDDEARLMIKK